MKTFLNVKSIDYVLSLAKLFPKTGKESLNINKILGRILAEDIYSDINIPNFNRSTMDGFAIKASSSFGSSESSPAYFKIKGKVTIGCLPNFTVLDGEAAYIPTGGALPKGSDSVLMIENTNLLDNTSIEGYKSLAPGANIIRKGEDIKKCEKTITEGTKIRPQEIGLIATSGKKQVKVFRKPIVTVISTGNEIIPSADLPTEGKIRDVNSHTLSGQIIEAGGIPKIYGIVPDKIKPLYQACSSSLKNSDIVIISGGSSVGSKDLTLAALEKLENTEILVHGISISPGKPTILARSKNKQIWGLPGHVTSTMVVFKVVVQYFLDEIAGRSQIDKISPSVTAILSRNIASSQGRVDYVRVKLNKKNNSFFAEPILGKSGLLNTMIKSDGLIKIGAKTEGLYKNTTVSVLLT